MHAAVERGNRKPVCPDVLRGLEIGRVLLLEPLLSDDSITEIMVVDENRIYVEKNGRISLSGYQFKSVDHLMRIIERIVTPLGRRIDTSSPMVDARLADGSRVNAIIPPLAADGPASSAKRFSIVTCC